MELQSILNKIKGNLIKDLIIVILIFFSTLAFLFITKNIDNGYHLTDDHEILDIYKDIKNNGLVYSSKLWLDKDITWRFRPIYMIHRIGEVYFFKDNFYYWSLWTALISSITIPLFYLLLRRYGSNIYIALSCTAIAFLGYSFSIWWRFGTAETLGALFLTLSILFAIPIKSLNKKYSSIFFVLFVILTAFTKEVFTLLVPGILFLRFYLLFKHSYIKNINEYLNYDKNILSFLLAVFLFNVYIILFYVGINKTGYAGFDSNINILKSIISILKGPSKQYFIILLLSACLSFISSLPNIIKERFYSKYIICLISLIFFLIPYLIIYLKTGIESHYLMPLTLIIAIYVAEFLNQINYKNIIYNIMSKVFILVIVAHIIFINIPFTYSLAKTFSLEGKINETLFNNISQTGISNIVILCDPAVSFEDSHSLNTYMTTYMNLNVEFIEIDTQDHDVFQKELTRMWRESFEKQILRNKIERKTLVLALGSNVQYKLNEVKLLLGDINNYTYIYNQTDKYYLYAPK